MISLVLSVFLASAALGQPPSANNDPLAWLSNALENDDRFNSTMMALRATGDKDLFPLFNACAQSGDKKRRLFAASALAEISPQQAIPVLQKMVQGDPVMTVRAEALVHLLELKALSADQLAQVVKVGDESVQCIAARSLVQMGQPNAARDVLTKLADSNDLATSSMAKMTLLLLGRQDFEAALTATMSDPKTPDDVLALLLEQIGEEKVTPARDMAVAVVKGNAAPLIKVRAFKALSAVAPAAPALAQAIEKSDDLVYRVHLLRLLAERGDSGNELVRLSKTKDLVGTLAKFELARKKDPAAAVAAAQAVFAAGHPVVVDYVLEAIHVDMKGDPSRAQPYVPALLELIRSVSPDANQMQAEHFRAANAARLLCDLGSKESVAGLQQILRGHYSAIVRATATGIYKSTNATDACLLAKEYLDSPFDELATDAALTLGRHGNPAGSAPLADIIAHAGKNPSPLVALACWYTLKIQGKTASAAPVLAECIK